MFNLFRGGSSTQGPTPSDLARKYGRARSPPLKDTGKSGMTPISLQPMDDSYSVEREAFDLSIYQYQIQRLSGFATKDLEDMGIINAHNAHLGDLDNPIHPLYRKELWADAPNLPLGHGLTGHWSARNPAVWAVLEPILRLASLFIANAHVWPWFDALLFCPRVELDYADMNGPGRPTWGGGLYRFSYRATHIAAQSKKSREVQNIFDHCARFVSMWHFNEGDPMVLGVTHNEMDNARIGITWIHLDPLLRDDLTHSERLVHQFHVAATVIHETGHALNMTRTYLERVDPNGGQCSVHEPFFGNEDVAELGYSVENAGPFAKSILAKIFGGTKEPLVGPGGPNRWVSKRTIWEPMKDHETPSMGLVTTSLPNYRTVDFYQRKMATENFDDGTRFLVRNLDRYAGNVDREQGKGVPPNEIWPMSIQLIQSLQTKTFWEFIVRAKGSRAFHSARIRGFRVDWWAVGEVEGADYQRWKDMQPLTPPDDFSNIQDAFKKWQLRDDFLTRAYAIKVVLAKQALAARVLDGERVKLRRIERTEIKLGPNEDVTQYKALTDDKQRQIRELRGSIAEKSRTASKLRLDLAAAHAKQRLVSNRAGDDFVKFCDDLANAIARPAPDLSEDWEEVNPHSAPAARGAGTAGAGDDEWEDLGSSSAQEGGAATTSAVIAKLAVIAGGNASVVAQRAKRAREGDDDDDDNNPSKRQKRWWNLW